MRITTRLSFALLLSLICARAVGADFVVSGQEFHGSGTAQVFDGGPVDQDSVEIIGPSHLGGSFSASDRTCLGSLCAEAFVHGKSGITLSPNQLYLEVELSAGYFPSFFPGGDNPGGTAQGNLTSVVEFVLPVDAVDWVYALRIDTSGFYKGSTRSLVANVSASQMLLDLEEETLPGIQTLLSGNSGDLIRITTQMSGGVDVEPLPFAPSLYRSRLYMWFTVPEPAGGWMLLMGSLFLVGRAQTRRNRVR